ncbi:MAG: hypothetical protein Kow0020_07790 [Wenzhouxiangellaceae bacterium]
MFDATIIYHPQPETGNRKPETGNRKPKTLALLSLLLAISVGGNAAASDLVQLDTGDFLVADSLAANPNTQIAEFSLVPSTGSIAEAVDYTLDLQTGVWSAVDGGDVYGGVFPPDQVQGWQFICLTNPWAFAACTIGTTVFSAAMCELGARRAWNRAIRSCRTQGGVRSYSAGPCGAGESFTCFERHVTQTE